ncbi:hypothetical protein Tco_0642849 [Tanacetum coccineum]
MVVTEGVAVVWLGLGDLLDGSVGAYDQLVLDVNQGFIYGVSIDVDMTYSSNSGNGSTTPPVKRKLVHAGSSSRSTHQKSSPAKAESSAFLTISNNEEGVVESGGQMKGECEVLKEREKDRDKEYEELRIKCEAAMADFDNNPAVNVLHQKIKSMSNKVKEHQASMDRLLLESHKWAGYQENLVTMESKVAALEAEKGKLEAAEVSMELVHSDEMAMLVGNLLSSAIFYRSCPHIRKKHTKAGNDLSSDTFPFLLEVIADPSASVKALLSKKPKSLRRPTPTKTHAYAPSAPSQKATPSSAPTPKLMSHPSAL